MEIIKKNRWIFIVVFVVVVLGSGAYLMLGRGDEAASAQAETDTAAVFIGDLAENATASGQVSAGREAALSLASSGKVESVPVSVGDTVAAGDVLV